VQVGVVEVVGAVAVGVGGGVAEVLAEREDGVVVRAGGVVAKAHAVDADRGELEARVWVAGCGAVRGVLLAPVPEGEPRFLEGRRVTVWPYGVPVDRDDPEAAPWEEAGTLLARLHRVPLEALPGPLPAMRGPAKVARALERMAAVSGGAAAATVRRAASALPAWARGAGKPPARPVLVHGDFHLGQLVRPPAGQWLLIDVDDLGVGEPAWDLARPAAWFATGLLAPGAWGRFLGAYRAAAGPAVPRDGDPWAALDVPARALTVQSAALAVARARREERELDEVDEALVDACARIADLPHADVVS
jgi:aminoglycoside phosphotransferase (APT) family kinase protein